MSEPFELSAEPVRLFIFDADDTLRRTRIAGQPCPHGPEQWELLPGVRETLQRYDWSPRGLRVGIASNQDHVGYGIVTEELAWQLLADMVHAAFGPIQPPARIELCPDPRSPCWKPAPGMLLAIMRHYRIPPQRTVFIGNSERDRQAALAARTRFLWSREFFLLD